MYVARTSHPNIADIHCYSELAQLEFLAYDFSGYANVTRWRAEIGAVPEVDEVHQTLRKVIQGFQAKAQAGQ